MEQKSFIGEFLEYFFGGMSPAMFFAAFVFAALGISFGLLIGTTKRDPLSYRTPYKFSWNFLWCDNTLRIYKSVATAIIAIFLSFRFAKKLFESINMEGFEMLYATMLGFCLDKVVERWRKKRETFFLSDKPNAKDNDKTV